MASSKSYTYIDLFAGCGGLSLGLGNAGWKGIFAIEKSPMAFSTFEHNLLGKESHFDWPEWLPKSNLDLLEVLKSHKKNLISLRGKVDLVAGGPPCQGFSMAGKRDESDIRNRLVHSYLELVDLVQPKMIFFENVSGITQRFKGEDGKMGMAHSDIVAKKLQKLGYKFPDMKILNLADYGLPQSRRRFIMIAIRGNEMTDFFSQLDGNKKAFLKSKKLPLKSNVKDALSDLLRLHGEEQCPDAKSFQSGVYSSPQSAFQRLMRKRARKGMVPDSHRFAKHFPRTVDVFKNVLKHAPSNVGLRGGQAKEYGIKKRNVTLLEASAPSPTILSIPDDYIHYCEPRIMTVRECARLQTFPDNFEFKEKYTSGGQMRKIEVPRYTQVGNAIPPLFAEQAGLTLKKFI